MFNLKEAVVAEGVDREVAVVGVVGAEEVEHQVVFIGLEAQTKIKIVQ